MKAIVLASYGGPEVLTLREVPDPEPGPEEVVVEIASAGVNRADLLQRMGLYPGPAMAHEVPGMELAGRVVARGARAVRWHEGDAVMGVVGGGAYAERIAVHERQLLPVPEALPLDDAGAVPEVFFTAWDALVLQGGLTPGRTALVHAGASGVGTAAIQLCKAIGARVVVTCSAGKVDACTSLGADLVVDYGSQDFVEQAKAFTGGAGVDVVLDVIGGDYLARNVDALRARGTIVQVGVMGSGSATFPLGALLPKRATIVGTVLRARPLEEKVALTQRFEREVLPWFADGTCVPVVDSRYALGEVATAHERMASNANVGKLVLRP
jgi:putative PIG3 family NAD(P)H quinone oxidoreductase